VVRSSIGSGEVAVDARPFADPLIPANIEIFLGKPTAPGAVASFVAVGIPDERAAIVRDNPTIRETYPVVNVNFFNEPSPDGKYGYQGATEHDLTLMRASCSPKVQVKAAGGVRDLDALIHCRDLGVTRCGATATAAMLDDYRRRAAQGTDASAGATGKLGVGEY